MLASLTLDVLAILAGAFGMLWLLQMRFGSGVTPLISFEDEFITGGHETLQAHQDEQPFIAMPDHLTTHAEMVAWMTHELPKLTEDVNIKPLRL